MTRLSEAEQTARMYDHGKRERRALLNKWADQGYAECRASEQYVAAARGYAVPYMVCTFGGQTWTERHDVFPSEQLIARLTLAIAAGAIQPNTAPLLRDNPIINMGDVT